ncbi:hypothetical protein BKA80DRAFT_285625 [Phyllosticta citrichinensis]
MRVRLLGLCLFTLAALRLSLCLALLLAVAGNFTLSSSSLATLALLRVYPDLCQQFLRVCVVEVPDVAGLVFFARQRFVRWEVWLWFWLRRACRNLRAYRLTRRPHKLARLALRLLVRPRLSVEERRGAAGIVHHARHAQRLPKRTQAVHLLLRLPKLPVHHLPTLRLQQLLRVVHSRRRHDVALPVSDEGVAREPVHVRDVTFERAHVGVVRVAVRSQRGGVRLGARRGG